MARTRTIKVNTVDEAKAVNAVSEKVDSSADSAQGTAEERIAALEKELADTKAELQSIRDAEACEACEDDTAEEFDDMVEMSDEDSDDEDTAESAEDYGEFDDPADDEDNDTDEDGESADFDESPMFSDDLVPFTSVDGKCVYIPTPLVPKFEDAILTDALSDDDVAALRGTVSDSKDCVNHPSHYNRGAYECIEVMIALLGIEAVKAFCACNVIKYQYRASMKNGEEDLAKADWYTRMSNKLGTLIADGVFNAEDVIAALREDK